MPLSSSIACSKRAWTMSPIRGWKRSGIGVIAPDRGGPESPGGESAAEA